MMNTYKTNAESGFLKWSRSKTQRNIHDNDQPGGGAPVSLASSLASDPDALMRLGRTGSA